MFLFNLNILENGLFLRVTFAGKVVPILATFFLHVLLVCDNEKWHCEISLCSGNLK